MPFGSLALERFEPSSFPGNEGGGKFVYRLEHQGIGPDGSPDKTLFHSDVEVCVDRHVCFDGPGSPVGIATATIEVASKKQSAEEALLDLARLLERAASGIRMACTKTKEATVPVYLRGST